MHSNQNQSVSHVSKEISESLVEMTEIVLPQHTNAIGSVFGGTVMSWVDIAAATCALRHCRCQVVTASIDALHFLAPVHLGWIVSIKASVNFTSRTSCEVGVKVTAENPLTGDRYHTASAYLTMVGVDKDGKPIPIPQIKLMTDLERRRNADASARRLARLTLKDDLAKRRRADVNGV
jgi:acyl-CoA hydrolase